MPPDLGGPRPGPSAPTLTRTRWSSPRARNPRNQLAGSPRQSDITRVDAQDAGAAGQSWLLFRDEDGSVPVTDWLDGLPDRARAKVIVRMERQEAGWHETRPGEVVHLGDGLHALRSRDTGTTYSVLYFHFALRSIVAVVGLTSKGKRPGREAIETALARKARFEADPRRFTFVPEKRPEG